MAPLQDLPGQKPVGARRPRSRRCPALARKPTLLFLRGTFSCSPWNEPEPSLGCFRLDSTLAHEVRVHGFFSRKSPTNPLSFRPPPDASTGSEPYPHLATRGRLSGRSPE